MSITEIIENGLDVSVTVKLSDLRTWLTDVIQVTRQELESVVIDEKAESYPTPKQVQEILHVDPTTLWRWNKSGYLKHIEFGGGRRYRMSDIKKILNPESLTKKKGVPYGK